MGFLEIQYGTADVFSVVFPVFLYLCAIRFVFGLEASVPGGDDRLPEIASAFRDDLVVAFGNGLAVDQLATNAYRERASGEKVPDGFEIHPPSGNQIYVGEWRLQSLNVFGSANRAARENLDSIRSSFPSG
jgi:hypothetical protein